MARDDEVGYGKPPQSTRWKPGQSGNLKGRPKADKKHLLQEAAAILSEPVTARNSDGATVQLGSLEAAYLAICTKAIKGNDAALYQAIRIMLEILPAGELAQAAGDARAAEAKRKLAAMIGLGAED